MGSAAFEAKRANDKAVVAWTVKIHFPAFLPLDLDEQTFYWSTGDQIELEDGNVYVQKLRAVPRGRHQRERGNDYAEFSASNVDHALYQIFRPYESIIETGEVTIRECYEIELNLWESEIRFEGYLKDFTNNDKTYSLDFTALSDMSRPNHFVGNRIITRERCGTNFNVGGVLPPDYPTPCTWQTAQGGNPNFCSKFLRGVDGCEAHNNSHQYYAVEGFKIAEINILPGDIDETGFPYESGPPCFTDNMFMVMDFDLTVLPLNEVTEGMSHLGFDIFNEDRLIESKIRKAWRHDTDHFWLAQFDMAEIETAYQHPFYVGQRHFVPVAALGEKPVLGIYSSRKRGSSVLSSIEKHTSAATFNEFRTSSGVYIICDRDKKFFYFVHNTKAELPQYMV